MARRRCTIVGGGPAGTYLALQLARLDAGFTVEVFDDAAGGGVGIVLDTGVVDLLRDHDAPSAAAVEKLARRWETVRLRVRDVELVTGGHVIYGIGRDDLVGILRARAASLGVAIRMRRAAPEELAGRTDLLVGADGAGSAVRRLRQEDHAPSVVRGRTQYLWMRADVPLVAGFWFAGAARGAFVAHVYPYAVDRSAVVVECSPEAAEGAGLARGDRCEVEAGLTALFADRLGGARLRACTFPWQPFRTVRNRRWHAGNQVLVGDAAHTTHFSVGSGTRLALEDAVTLAGELARCTSVPVALARYERARRPVVDAVQTDARSSQLWFETLDRHLGLPPHQLAFALRTRRDVNSFAWLRQRDPAFTGDVIAAVAADPRAAGSAGAAAPRLLPLRLGPVTIASRLAVVPPGVADAGTPAGLLLCTDGTLLPPQGPAVTGALLWAGADPDRASAGADCLLVAGPWPLVRERLVNLRRRPGQAVGALVESTGWGCADAEFLRSVTDFVAVRPDPDGQRVERTRLAEELRNVHGFTVLLWTAALSGDEADTLIGAGRIDGYLRTGQA